MLASLLIVTTNCQVNKGPKIINGNALGTTYTIKHDSNLSNNDLIFEIDNILEDINNSMSTYDKDSDISKINNGYLIQVDQYFRKVYEKSFEIWIQTGGAFDPTVGSLVNAYGFGPDQKNIKPLSETKIDSLLQLTGFDKIKLDDNGVIVKSNKNVKLDFNAIAKGFTVDIISKYIEKQGGKNFLVEIGGEIFAKGINPKNNQPWKIGIEYPDSSSLKRKNYDIYSLNDKAIATSGNYRHFRLDKITGKKFYHTIDPRTGKSVQSKILSASVISSDCITADAWATSLMVLSLNEGINLVESNSNIEALWIISTDSGFKSVFSSGW